MPHLLDFFPAQAADLLKMNGLALVRKIGLDTVRAVVLDIMSGRNLRDATEAITRRRIAYLNLAIVEFFLKGLAQNPSFAEHLPMMAAENLKSGSLKKVERWLDLWALGLTDKGVQNILRDRSDRLDAYRDEYIKTCQQAIAEYGKEISGEIQMTPDLQAQCSWSLLLAMLNMAGSQTLAIRGSDKSLNGKLFEKLILGSLLHVLGFSYSPVGTRDELERIFWLSSHSERRESDATLLFTPGRAVRFDIGFIGRGNPEISLDKVTRFERRATLQGQEYFVSTIIIVDRIGKGSRLKAMAEQMQGHVVQMSAAFWVQDVACILNELFGFEHPLMNMEQSRIHGFLQEGISGAPLEDFLGLG